jgi:hypothetical protein
LNGEGTGVMCSDCVEGYTLSPGGICVRDILYCDPQCQTCNDVKTYPLIEDRRKHCTSCKPAEDGTALFIVTERADLSTQCGECFTTLESLQAHIDGDSQREFNADEDHIYFFGSETEPENQFCRSCLPGCLTCSAMDTCETCQEGFVQRTSDGTCVRVTPQVAGSCDVGYYIDQDDPTKCFPCHHSCEACVGREANQCLSCKSGEGAILTNFYKNKCTCTPGNYYDEEKNTCEPCHSSCMFCVGGAQDQCTRCAVPGSKPFFNGNDYGECFPCATQREAYQRECPDDVVFRFDLSDDDTDSETVLSEEELARAADPVPGVPSREQPAPGFKTKVPDSIGQILADDEDIKDSLFQVEIPTLTNPEDYTTECDFNPATNEFDLRILFNVDTDELEATVSIPDPSILENYSPSPEADQLNQQALQDFLSKQNNRRILISKSFA